MALIDYIIVALYVALVIGLSAWVGKRQKNKEDYFLGGRAMAPWQVALSVVATQVSAISLIGAPAFIALRKGGGLVWLQYEFAIPLAMMIIMLLLVPLYHATGAITIYEYLERRFGRTARTTLSGVFLLSRGLGSGVALLATGIVVSACMGLDLWETILLIGLVSVIYTTFGGIVADIYSDIIQLFILWGGALLMVGIIWSDLGAGALSSLQHHADRMMVFDFSHTGFFDGATFSFWPMLFGGLFLYLSYYGCDQSQAQRLLTTPNAKKAQKALMINGVLRFPLVLTYSAVGILLIPFIDTHREFLNTLVGKKPDFLVPQFMVQYVPQGFLGLLVAGIFAASMSSIDSAMNSLSAATYQDFLIPIRPKLARLSPKAQVRLGRLLTALWGAFAVGFALLMIKGPETVLELVNKIGSAFYGPILAVFFLGMLTRRVMQRGAVVGLISGVVFNMLLWLFFRETVSWMWWNVTGFAVAFSAGLIVDARTKPEKMEKTLEWDLKTFLKSPAAKKYSIVLLVAFVLIIAISAMIEVFL